MYMRPGALIYYKATDVPSDKKTMMRRTMIMVMLMMMRMMMMTTVIIMIMTSSYTVFVRTCVVHAKLHLCFHWSAQF